MTTLQKQCPFKDFGYQCEETNCRNCPQMKEARSKARQCDICGADLEVWEEMRLGEHNHFKEERK